jgi:hypothetical protein
MASSPPATLWQAGVGRCGKPGAALQPGDPMGRSSERMQDSQHSVWSLDTDEPQPAATGWLATLTGWQRRGVPAPPPQAPPAQPVPVQADATPSRPAPSRGQALRQAHRALRDRLRAQRDLRRVLPHLYYIERALARQGSAALQEMPVRVLQRGLQQLARLPADNLAERLQFSVLQQRLDEAIQARGSARNQTPRRPPAPVDSFLGGLDSGPAALTGPGGLEVSEVPQSVYDDLMQGDQPDHRDTSTHTGGWRRG